MFSQKNIHIIFLVHGIGGDKSHFGYMAKALPKVLRAKDPTTKYLVRSVEYETGHDEKIPYDFAKDLAGIINKSVVRFQEKDKFSLIMHSQGGLVGSIWMLQSLMEREGYSSPQTVEYLDAFITLATPFWGAKTARWGRKIKKVIEQIGIDIPLRYGREELEQMSFGSDNIFEFRRAMIDAQYQPFVDKLRKKVRFLNVVGVADVLNPLGIFVSGTDKYEDDGAVPLASARFNFLYIQSIKDVYEDGDRMSLDHVKTIEMAPHVVVNALHRSPFPEIPNFTGIAQIPKACVTDYHYPHPTFPYLWRHVLGKPITQLDHTLGDYKAFLLDVNVRLPEGTPESEVDVEFFKLDGTPLQKGNVMISKSYEIYSKGKRKSHRYPNHYRFYTTGSIGKSLGDRVEALLIKISAEGFKTRFVEMQLKESYSSFVDVNLLPQ